MDTSRFESIQQTERHPTRTSSAYRFVSTRVVLGAFAELGWFPVTVREARVRKPENRGFQQHLVRLRSPEFARREIAVGDAIPEIVVKNAHNGDSALQLFAGIFEKVCSNGLMVQRSEDRVRLPHLGFAPWMIESAVKHLGGILSRAFADRERWRGLMLEEDARLAFADAAAALRFERYAVEAEDLLRPRRWEQADRSLWSVYNTVQENIMRGGVPQSRQDGSRFPSRPVRSVDEEVRLNLRLWRLAAALEKAVTSN
jgi:Domain of unknown function (DUF932)